MPRSTRSPLGRAPRPPLGRAPRPPLGRVPSLLRSRRYSYEEPQVYYVTPGPAWLSWATSPIVLVPFLLACVLLMIVISWIQQALTALGEWIDATAAYVSSHLLLVGSVTLTGIVVCIGLIYGSYRVYRALREFLSSR